MIRAILKPVPCPTSFQEALTAARGGDAEALADLTERFYPTVQRLVHGKLARDLRTSRPWLAARFSTGDVVQDVFHAVLRDLDAFAGEGEQAFVGYLAMVVRNRILDAVRFHEAERRDGRRNGGDPNDLSLPATGDGPADEASAREYVGRLQRALSGFEPREQLLLRARLEQQATFAELAAQLGFGTESGARRAFYSIQARLTLILKEG
ncbi:MAG: sigma-70 family RNA polymerase sigma factor [Planctomycetota bacterium]|nr:sigma-70 family RNA polymerase sigma factor [Planctomycetota bacterium]